MDSDPIKEWLWLPKPKSKNPHVNFNICEDPAENSCLWVTGVPGTLAPEKPPEIIENNPENKLFSLGS